TGRRASGSASGPTGTAGPAPRRTSSMSESRIVLPIEGMSCASCAATVQEALSRATGVATASVNYATARAAVSYDDAQTNVAELIRTVRAAGYDCGKASVRFGVGQV